MLKVKEPILADDPYRVLQYEQGVFEVVSPTGARLRVTCPLQRSSIPQANETDGVSEQAWWRIEKIIEA
jgi:hypothetical protein